MFLTRHVVAEGSWTIFRNFLCLCVLNPIILFTVTIAVVFNIANAYKVVRTVFGPIL